MLDLGLGTSQETLLPFALRCCISSEMPHQVSSTDRDIAQTPLTSVPSGSCPLSSLSAKSRLTPRKLCCGTQGLRCFYKEPGAPEALKTDRLLLNSDSKSKGPRVNPLCSCPYLTPHPREYHPIATVPQLPYL